ncbi:MAG: hypothetical protein NVS2B7_40280 [Herpetosiphon sp.]
MRFAFPLVIGVALVAKLVLALTSVGTNDAVTWLYFLQYFQRQGGSALYHQVGLFNHPPFMLHMLQLMHVLAVTSGISFYFWLRVPAIAADIVTAVLLWNWWRDKADPGASTSVLLLATAPASIMISGFHGNTDPVMICFVVLCVLLIDRGKSAWLAGLALGMSMNIKVLPVIFLPVILLALPDARKRIAFCLAAGATFVAGGLPYILHDPVFIARRLLGYDSLYGFWGISRYLEALASYGSMLEKLNQANVAFGKYVMLAVIVGEAIWMSRLRHKPRLFRQCGVIALTFMALTPGFGVQYLAWLVPWVVVEFWTALLFYATSGIFLFMIYTSWAGGFPWYLAVSFSSRGNVIYAERVCWTSICGVLIFHLWTLHRSQASRCRLAELTLAAT